MCFWAKWIDATQMLNNKNSTEQFELYLGKQKCGGRDESEEKHNENGGKIVE